MTKTSSPWQHKSNVTKSHHHIRAFGTDNGVTSLVISDQEVPEECPLTMAALALSSYHNRKAALAMVLSG